MKNVRGNFYKIFSELKKITCLLKPNSKIEFWIIMFGLLYFGSIAIFFLYNFQINSNPEMTGYDTYSHIDTITPKLQLIRILRWNIRHPLFCLFYSPILLITKLFFWTNHVSVWIIFLLSTTILFSFILLLIYKLLVINNVHINLSLVLLALFCSFSHTILLSIQVESFNLTMFFTLLLIFSTYYEQNKVRDNIFVFLLVGTTSTNILKLFTLFYLKEKSAKDSFLRFFNSIWLFTTFILLTLSGLLYRICIKKLSLLNAILGDTLSYTHSDISKIKLLISNFLAEPILFHSRNGIIYSKLVISDLKYTNSLSYFSLILLYLLFFTSLWINKKEFIAKLFILFFIIDLVIHFLIGYGISETHLFCGHWFFFIPILLGLLFKNIKNKRVLYAYIICLGFLILYLSYYNLSAYYESVITYPTTTT